jgi:hypothetical protein
MNGYLVLIDGARYVVQAETAQLAEQRARAFLGTGAQRIGASRKLTEAEIAVLQLYPGEVRPYPAEHG